MTSDSGPPGCPRSLPEVAASPLLPPIPDCQGGVEREECVAAKECDVEEGKPGWMAANAAKRSRCGSFHVSGWDEIEGVEGSLRDFLLEQAGVSY